MTSEHLPRLWADPTRWPRAPGRVFMAEAAWMVGDHLLGEDWRDTLTAEQVAAIAFWIGERCRSGKIRSALAMPGERMVPGDRADWFDDDHIRRVVHCEVRRNAGGRFATSFRCFLNRADLQSQLVEDVTAQVDSSPDALPALPRGEKGEALLRRFYNRVQSGETLPTSTAEYNAICAAWGDSREAPSRDTWDRIVGPYWRRLTYSGGRQQIDPQAAAHLERITAT